MALNKPRHGPDVVSDEDNGAFGTPPVKPPDPLGQPDSDASEEAESDSE